MSSVAFDYNLKEIENSVIKSDSKFPWHDFIGKLFNPDNIPPPILLRPIVENIISNGDIDIIYPEEWIDDYLKYIGTICEANALHFLLRSYDRRGSTLKIYNLDADSWIQIDIHIKLYQFGSSRIYFKWQDFFPRAQCFSGVLEPDAADGAALYLLHLEVQRKKLSSPSVTARWNIYQNRLTQIDVTKTELDEIIESAYRDGALFKDKDIHFKIRQQLLDRLNLSRDHFFTSFMAHTGQKIQKFFGRYFLKSKKIFFVGADGAGKTSLMRALSHSTKIIPNVKTHRGYLFYRIAKKISKKRGNGTQASDVFPRFFFLVSVFRTGIIFLINTKRIIFFDRSPNDILITNRKNDKISLYSSSKFLTRLTAGIFTVHVHSKNNDQFENKKNEMTDRQIKLYNSFMYQINIDQRPNNYLHFINAPSIDKSAEILRKILGNAGVVVNEK